MATAQDLNYGKLPGFGLPLNWTPPNVEEASKFGFWNEAIPRADLFPTALNTSVGDLHGPQMHLITLRETTMLHLMNQLTDELGWEQKVFDSAFIATWKEKALSEDITERMTDWCIAELQFKAKAFHKNGGLVSVYNGDVVKSDSAIPPALQAALQAAVAPLEDVPVRLKDWQAGSDGLVLDLVNPRLFPLLHGLSRILTKGVTTLEDCIERCGEGHPEMMPKMIAKPVFQDFDFQLYSAKFQWLPCEVDISTSDSNSVRITSYINNLHPKKYSQLYGVIEQVIARAIPLWNMTLSPLKLGVNDYRRIVYDVVKYDPDPKNWPEEDGPQQEEGEAEHEYYDRRQEWIETTRRVVLPEPGTFQPPPYITDPKDQVDLRRDYGHRGLQVIVKLTNIHLTPEKPVYKGGSWRVKCQMNEHICATALYYYDCENITNGPLAFRQQSCRNGIGCSMVGPNDWHEPIFGCPEGISMVQEVGAVETRAGRLVTFPNILQYRVEPFALKDRSKPGHRKVLELFLVDPGIKIISTGHVPCQQKDWWREVVSSRSPIGDLPLELQDQIFQAVEEFPLDIKEAKDLRLEWMKARKRFAPDNL